MLLTNRTTAAVYSSLFMSYNVYLSTVKCLSIIVQASNFVFLLAEIVEFMIQLIPRMINYVTALFLSFFKMELAILKVNKCLPSKY